MSPSTKTGGQGDPPILKLELERNPDAPSLARAAIVDARERLWARAARINDTATRERFLTGVPDNVATFALASRLAAPS